MTESKWPLWVMIAVILALAACLGWLFPSSKRTEKALEIKSQENADLQKQIEAWKIKSLDRTTYYENGRIKSRTTLAVDEGTRSRENSHTLTDTDTKTHELTITKRGQFVVGGGINQAGTPSLMIQSTLLGPLGLAGMASISPIPLKIDGGAAYVTLAF